MKPTPFRIIMGVNALVVLGGLIIAYGSGATHDDGGKITTLLMPFAVSLIDLVFGVACALLMLVLSLFNRDASAALKTYMEAFLAAFGLVLIFAVPACFAGMNVR